jgi:FkbM family methyltransferase
MKIQEILTALYRACLSPAKKKSSYSQCGEDAVLAYLFAGKRSGFYVDVGCHHPKRGSNTFLFYKRGWQGILIDMEPAKVLACRLVRWRDTCVLAAVSDREEDLPLYAPHRFSVLATISPLATDDSFQEVGRIKTRTLTGLLQEYGAPQRFELLSIDAEGVDYQVLNSLDVQQFRPQVICIEIWQMKDGIDALLRSPFHAWFQERDYALASWAGLSAIYTDNASKHQQHA